MANTIGAYDVELVRGRGADQTEGVAVTEEPGVDGYYFQLIGFRGGDFEFAVVDIDTEANCLALSSNLQGYVGQVIDIVNDLNETYADVVVESVSVPIVRACISEKVSPPEDAFRLTCTIRGRFA